MVNSLKLQCTSSTKKIKDEKSNIKIVESFRANFNHFTFFTLIFTLSLAPNRLLLVESPIT